MKCKKCGYENNDNAKFCNDCGEKLYKDKEKQVHIDNAPIKEEKSINNKTKLSNLSDRKKIMIGFIPLVIIIIIVEIIYANTNTLKPEEVFGQFKTDKNIALEQYNKLSNSDKQKVQVLAKDDINNIYNSKDDVKLSDEIALFYNMPELKEYIDNTIQNMRCRKTFDDLQKEIDKANGINNMKDYEWLTLLDKYCSIPNTFENYEAVLDKIILLRDKYYSRFFDIPKSMKDRNIKLGMTKKEVLASSWGRPKNINKTTNSNGTKEQWCYYGNNYLYFEGDKLTTIQN